MQKGKIEHFRSEIEHFAMSAKIVFILHQIKPKRPAKFSVPSSSEPSRNKCKIYNHSLDLVFLRFTAAKVRIWCYKVSCE